MPVQAPQEYTDKYMGKYDEGWASLRERRLESAKALGVVPADTKLAPVSSTADWESLTDEEKKYKSKEMAVYAGMIDAMDHHIGRLLEYLKDTDQYDNTVFIFTSDNGPEGTKVLTGARALYLRLWFATHGYNMDYETLGTRGSFVDIGPSFGNAALFKGDYKIVIDRGPVGDGEWHLFNFVTDPGEASDLKEEMPELFAEMMEEYRTYMRDYRVLPVPDGYDQRKEVFRYVLRNNPDPLLIAIVAGFGLLIVFLAWRGVRAIRKRRSA
ncbi:MAG: sulfatase-like hydrolase/transferase [Myxococcales bacterium]|nr:sulfatase-like hydrolase/transferase [Myxococcales bacterium]